MHICSLVIRLLGRIDVPKLGSYALGYKNTGIHILYSVFDIKHLYGISKLLNKAYQLSGTAADLFTCDTPLGKNFDEFSRLSGMDDDLFAYEVKLPEPSQALAVILINGKLIRLIDITLKKWLDLKFGDHRKVDKEVMESVVSTWLIRSYKKQFEEYMNIKRQLEVNGINTDIVCDPTNVEFATWLASKFSNHVTMDWYAKNALWIYWKRGDDDEVLTDEELSDLEKENLDEENKIAEIFKIETNIFHFETPLCMAFKEFNYLLQIDWNSEVPWADEKPWLEDGTWKVPIKDVSHVCKPFRFNSGHVEWPTCKRREEGHCDGDLKEEALKQKAISEGSRGHETRKGLNFCAWMKKYFGDNHELDYKLMTMLQKYWWGMKEEESSDDAWIYYSPITDSENYEHTSQIENDVNSNYNPYLDVSRIFESRAGTNYDDTIQTNQEWFNERKSKGDNDNDIEDLDDYLVRDDAPFIINEEEERFKEKRCKLLGIPYKKPPNVQVFSIWKAFGGNTRDFGSFGEETNKTTDLHQHLSRISTQKLETASQITRDAVITHTKTASQHLKTASEYMTQPII
ncbi:hypothetical protein Tco_0024167 [Tanacetum coccineum]